MTGPVNVQVTIESPGDLAAVIVQLHKEDPAGRILIAGFNGAWAVTGTAHLGMASPDPRFIVRETTKFVGLVRQWPGTSTAAVVAFGPEHVADPYLDMAAGLVGRMLRMPLIDAIRVHDGRYWSYTCDAPEYGRDSTGEPYEELSDLAIEAAITIAAELGGGS